MMWCPRHKACCCVNQRPNQPQPVRSMSQAVVAVVVVVVGPHRTHTNKARKKGSHTAILWYIVIGMLYYETTMHYYTMTTLLCRAIAFAITLHSKTACSCPTEEVRERWSFALWVVDSLGVSHFCYASMKKHTLYYRIYMQSTWHTFQHTSCIVQAQHI